MKEQRTVGLAKELAGARWERRERGQRAKLQRQASKQLTSIKIMDGGANKMVFVCTHEEKKQK